MLEWVDRRGRGSIAWRRMAAPLLSLAEFQQRVTDRFPTAKLQILAYTHSQKPADIRCGRCSHEFTIRADTIYRNGMCPMCDTSSVTKKRQAKERAQAKVKNPLLTVEDPELTEVGKYRYVFTCAKHGRFTLNRLSGCEVRCQRCHGNLPPTHPDLIPRARRGVPCALYLIEVRDSVGVWVKVGISTNMPQRVKMYGVDGVKVLRTFREYHTTLYRANCVEMELKRWARRQLGRRVRPRKKWSGWSESFRDPGMALLRQFDALVLLDKHRRS